MTNHRISVIINAWKPFKSPNHCKKPSSTSRIPTTASTTSQRGAGRMASPARTCGSKDVIFLANQSRWQCREKHPLQQFTLKTGTIMEDSPIGLDKWLMAMWQIVNCKNGISSYEVHRAIGITQKSAWFMDHRIRFALGMGPGNKLSGQIEADETFIGGKARNMHARSVRADHRHWRQRQDRRHGHLGARRQGPYQGHRQHARRRHFNAKSVSMC